MNKHVRLGLTCLLAMWSVMQAGKAVAEPFAPWNHPGPHWHGPVGWHDGYWHHGAHDGRLGWWWVVGGVWYFYDAPVYPYPGVPVEVTPPPTVVTVTPAPPVAAPEPQMWYYCKPLKQYYPYINNCPEEWTRVPVTPPSR